MKESFMLNKPAWSPYVAGILIGLLQFPAFLWMDTGLGASSSFVKMSTYILPLLDFDVRQLPYFKDFVSDPTDLWQMCLVFGVVLGAYISSKSSGLRRGAPSPVWNMDYGLSNRRRYVLAFMGGFILIFGARLAGGCTSGHGLTGIGRLSVGSFIAVFSIFAGGIVSSLIWRGFASGHKKG
jgi:uncharacterized protein